ncbi:MAG TPA: hypothetical protein VE736_10490 [Gaiellaceae bacterium]|nr:hypothetical protein [Gaiellaceae bacterium]
MAEDVRELFAEYADSYVRGDHPQARDFLARAGEEADELAALLETFLAAAPPPAPDPDTLAVVEAWAEGEPPLVHLRASRGVRVDDVVDAIVEDAGVAADKRAKVKGYYQRLEQGLLDPTGVSETVWNVVRRFVGPISDAAVGWRAHPVTAEPAYFRAASSPMALGLRPPAQPEAERDEVDELFT